MITASLLKKYHIPFKLVSLDPKEYSEFKGIYNDTRNGIDDQKLLEYFISYKFLDFNVADVYIDIASQDCPFAFFIKEKFSCKVYRQDLYYLDPGINGEAIGGDACHIPLASGSVTKISLHNSFEHFEGNNDIDFILEAQRLLAIGGQMIIVPFFIGEHYQEVNDSGWIDSSGEKHLWGIGARFSREYNPVEMIRRVYLNANKFRIESFLVENTSQLGNNVHEILILRFTRVARTPIIQRARYKWLLTNARSLH